MSHRTKIHGTAHLSGRHRARKIGRRRVDLWTADAHLPEFWLIRGSPTLAGPLSQYPALSSWMIESMSGIGVAKCCGQAETHAPQEMHFNSGTCLLYRSK